MAKFLKAVLEDLYEQGHDLSTLTFILPNKRAGVFLREELSQLSKRAMFLPNILSIQDFTEQLSDLKPVGSIELLFEFYHTYLELTPTENQESFDVFSKWAITLLQDFNEIDSYLIQEEKVFEYISATKELDHWSLGEKQTPLTKKYLTFWKQIQQYYYNLRERLLDQQQGYKGLIYREAVKKTTNYAQNNPNALCIFIGFNALNTAESTIIQKLLEQHKALIYWDIDEVFLQDHIHDASHFIRQYKTNWQYYKSHTFKWPGKDYVKPKKISVIGSPKHITQVKYVGTLLESLYAKNKLKSTAVVLANETLLIPLLNSLPSSIKHINITMGLPLKQIPLASFITHWIKLQSTSSVDFYYKDVVELLQNTFLTILFKYKQQTVAGIIEGIRRLNKPFLTKADLVGLAADDSDVVELIFSSIGPKVSDIIQQIQQILLSLKAGLQKQERSSLLALEYIYRFHEIFNTIQHLNNTYGHIKSIAVLQDIYHSLLANETLDFKGEPLQGLQIMGVLESRGLDFETLILVSVNEGTLPAGKRQNSFIPFEVKCANNLPTYKEKDAIYAYHFYRLLQRVHSAYLLYNTEPDPLNGGEQSRFITQIEVEGIHQIQHSTIASTIHPFSTDQLYVPKTAAVMEQLQKLATSGLSPSSLSNYIRNPLDFYKEKILHINPFKELEETIAQNTLGTIVHLALEQIYKPFEGQFLQQQQIKDKLSGVKKIVQQLFDRIYIQGAILKGKNLIAFEIAQQYVLNFMNFDIRRLDSGAKIKLLHVEYKTDVLLSFTELPFPIRIKGVIDRVEICDGTLMIIDYKTGKVEASNMEIINLSDFTLDYENYSKSFQILMYAYMVYKQGQANFPMEAAVISFKNLKKGLLKFAQKDRLGPYAKRDYGISTEILEDFHIVLKELLLEIFNSKIPFLEKEVKYERF